MFLPLGSDLQLTRRPWVTLLWTAICLLSFVTITWRERGVSLSDSLTVQAAFVPAGEMPLWKLFSYQFMHASWIHLLSNIWYLAVFGWIAESLWGSWWFLVLSLVSGAVAVLPEIVFQVNPNLPIVGSSGAVAFAIGSILALQPKTRIRFLLSPLPLPEIPMTFWVPVKVLVYFWLFLQVSGLASVQWGVSKESVAYATHLTGFALGLCAGFFDHRRGSEASSTLRTP